MNTPLLKISHLSKSYGKRALFSDLSFTIQPNQTIALVGRSGSGKSTLGKILVRLEKADSGEIYYKGKTIDSYPRKDFRREVQIVFQNPYTSMNPLMKIEKILKEPLDIHRIYSDRIQLESLLEAVSLPKKYLEKYPHQLSGGERQRICIARSLSLNPNFIVLDEVLSSLDEKNQKIILALLQELKEQYSMSYLFITHNKTHAREFADEIISMDSSLKKLSSSDMLLHLFQ